MTELKRIIKFLEENEQYGDDWSKEIAVLQKLTQPKSVTAPLNVELTEDEVTDLLSNPDKRVTLIFDKETILRHLDDNGILVQVINHGSIHSEDNQNA